jgi:delta1-piperideine-2-carboxylate reductase
MHEASISDGILRITWDELVSLLERIFVRRGASEAVSRILARNCAAAERDGSKSHGVFRIPGYVAALEGGWIDGRAEPHVEDAAPGVVRVDARNGFAQAALGAATPLLVKKARSCGIAIAAIRNAHHIGALWPDVEPFARDGFLAIAWVNSRKRVVPSGGRSPVYGTNPMAFAFPRHGDPIVFDQASSAMSNGDIRVAAKERRAVPPGAGVDRDGNLTTDPQAILDGGALLPFGGYKGSSIAMMTEILAAALGAASFSHQFDDAHPERDTFGSGETVIVIDPTMGGTDSGFRSRVETFLSVLKASGQERLPGDRRYRNRRVNTDQGIPIAADTLRQLRQLAAS